MEKSSAWGTILSHFCQNHLMESFPFWPGKFWFFFRRAKPGNSSESFRTKKTAFAQTQLKLIRPAIEGGKLRKMGYAEANLTRPPVHALRLEIIGSAIIGHALKGKIFLMFLKRRVNAS